MLLAVNAVQGVSAGWPAIAAVVLSGVCSGALAAWLADRRAKRIEPEQSRALAAQATQAAIETVDAALGVARERIASLEARVSDLSEHVGVLRGKLEFAGEDRDKVTKELTLALIERAKLQEQITEIRTQLARAGMGRLENVRPPDAILMVRMVTGVIEYATDGVYALLGYPPGELVGMTIEELVPQASREQHVRDRAAFSRERRNRQMGSGIPLRALTASGEEIPVDISLHPTGDGRVLVLIKRRPDDS